MLDIKLNSMTYPNGYIALSNIELRFPDNGMYMVVGESGSGKSTLVQCLAGMLDFSGSLCYDGTYLESEKLEEYSQQIIAYIFQDYRLFEGLTAIENVILGGEIVGKKVDKQEALNLLHNVGLGKFCDKKVKLLSGGEKQRVAIARAIAKDTRIIVADEPTGNLDKRNTNAIMALLKNLSKHKLVLVVTHDEKSAQEFGDKIIRIADGKVVEIVDNAMHQDGNRINTYIVNDEQNEVSQKQGRIKGKSFWRLVFLKNYGSKLIATTILTLIMCIFALASTTIATLNKVNLTERYLAKQQGYFAKTSFIYKNGSDGFIQKKDEEYAYYMQCAGWYVDLPRVKNTAEDLDQEYSTLGKVNYCMQLGNDNAGIELLHGESPKNINEVCLPKNIAKLLNKNIESVVGQNVSIFTGVSNKDFIITGVFEDYLGDEEDCFLNKCIIIFNITELLNYSTAERYLSDFFRCKKQTFDIVLYNANVLGRDVAVGEALLSPALMAVVATIDSKEYMQGIVSFTFSDIILDNQYTIKNKIAGVDESLPAYAMVLNENDYFNLIDIDNLRYSGTAYNLTKHKTAKMYKEIASYQNEVRCYISSNYMPTEFINTVITIEEINIKIMLPIAIVFWSLSVICMYIMLKNLALANKRNYNIMRTLGIKRSQFMLINCVGNLMHLAVVVILSVIIVTIIFAILSSLSFIMSIITAFVGWEFLIMFFAMVLAIICVGLYTNKAFIMSKYKI